MKKKIVSVMTTLVMIFVFVGAMPSMSVGASNKVVFTPGEAYKSGKYIYYAYEMSGVRMDIMRLNTKTMKKKRIVSYKLNGNSTNGFYNITVKGNYIYATWDKFYGTSGSLNYIYRFSKNGKSKKKLAMGSCPVIAGDYIYYIQEKNNTYGGTSPTGDIYRMKLDGTEKHKVKSVGDTSYVLYKYKNTVLYSLGYMVNDTLYTLNGNQISTENLDINFTSYPYSYEYGYDSINIIPSGNYNYYVKESSSPYRNLYRKNLKTGKAKKIASFNDILSFRVCGNYIMIKCSLKNDKYGVYCLNIKKGTKKKLASWMPAE